MTTTATKRNGNQAKTQPAHKIRVGASQCTIWRNESEDGQVYYTTTCVHVYKNEQQEWVESSSFLESQLLELAKAADMAHSWIIERRAEVRAELRS